MSESVSAAISIQGRTLRYAEVQREDEAPRLLRIGTETFSFDLTQALLGEEKTPERVSKVGAVLSEGLGDTEARELRVVVHPLDGFSFFTPISSNVPVRERKRQLLQQAALVTGARSAGELKMESQTVRTAQDSEGEPYMWVHVLAFSETVDSRMAELVNGIPVDDYRWMLSSQAVTHALRYIERTGGSAQEALRPYTLALGQYPTHTEFSLSRNRDWYHAHYTEEAGDPQSLAYFAVGFLNRVEVPLDAVGRFFVYGLDVNVGNYAPFVTIFGRSPETLDPFPVFQGGQAQWSDVDAQSYAPCVGAGLGEFVG